MWDITESVSNGRLKAQGFPKSFQQVSKEVLKDEPTRLFPQGIRPKNQSVLPYYQEFYRQVVDTVKVLDYPSLSWLDLGCGTGKMGEAAFSAFAPKRFVFWDQSPEMIAIAKAGLPTPMPNLSPHPCWICTAGKNLMLSLPLR